MDLERLYDQVNAQIQTLDFSKLWEGFVPLKFALYNDSACFYNGNYIEKTDAFLANTAICYNGEWIAIWNVAESIDPVILTSKIVHEMFHGFQMANNDSRFFDDMDALYHYKYTEGNLNLKAMENRLLCHLADRFDEGLFDEFLGIRKLRQRTYPYEYHYEACIEQIEGAANYVELQCLKQLSAALFRKALSATKERVADQNNLLPVRIICYDIGALLLLVMTENRIAFDSGFSPVPFSEAILEGIEERICTPDISVKALVDAYYSKASETVRRAVERNDLVCDTPDDLLAVNIYNAVCCRNYIISKFFVMYGSEENPKVEYGDFVIETTAYKKLSRIYRIV